MTPDCTTCRYCVSAWDDISRAKVDRCTSPQIVKSTNRPLRTILERTAFDEDHDWWRVSPEMRKCGPDGLNYEAKA